jgi:putative ABC transport system substrate-binding protein
VIDRRAFVTGLGSLLAAPLAAEAQQAGKVYRVGALSELPRYAPTEERWRRALARYGYVEGRNTTFEFRWGDGSAETLRVRAAELIALNPDVILTSGHPAAVAAKRATTTIPIVAMSANPVADGLVASLARPGGNVTGVVTPMAELAAKRIQLMKEIAPDIASLAIVYNPANPTARLQRDSAEAAAHAVRIAVQLVPLASRADVETAFKAIVARGTKSVVVMQDAVTFQSGPAIAALAAKHRLPSSLPYREHAEAGALMSCGLDLQEMVDLVAAAADKILKGVKPADIPMQQPVKTELVINLKTAKALGLTIPPSLLLRADQVIE